jgi:hypothetical protein
LGDLAWIKKPGGLGNGLPVFFVCMGACGGGGILWILGNGLMLVEVAGFNNTFLALGTKFIESTKV